MLRKSLRLLCILFSLALFPSLAPSAFGQAVNATLLGTVTDATGAAVAGASITVTHTATSTSYAAITNESGNYTVPNLPPGSYSVTVQAKGFKKDTHQNISVLVNTSTRVDVSLVPGSVSESVEVTTAPPLLQTDRGDISTKIEAHQLENLPLSTNRNFQSILNLVPGAAPAVYQHSQFFNSASSLQTEVNGQARLGNLYQIEGIDDDERTGLLQMIIPPAESIQSVDVSTNNYDAELGRATGAVTNVTLKSGTNTFHGSAFEYIQNNAVNARSYFGGPLGHLSYNYYGGSIGGPVLKDKLFFFGDYLTTSDHELTSGTYTIPDPRYYTPNANGFIDLSAALTGTPNANGYQTGQVFNPTTGDGTAAHPRTPFVNNQIPFSMVNPVSLAILQKVDAAAPAHGTLNPNAPLSNPANNYTDTLPFTKGAKSFDVKMDFAMNERNHLSARYSFQRVNVFQAPAFGSFLGGPGGGAFEGTGVTTGYSTGLNYDHVFSPTLFTEVRFGVGHVRNVAQPSDYGNNDATTLGIPGVNIAGQPFTAGQVGITINGGFTGTLIGYSASLPWIRAESNIDAVNNWTKIIKNHTIKFGGDVRRVRDDLLQDQTFSPRGVFNFSDVQTSDAAAAGKTNIANDMASFLFDIPSSTGRDLNTFFPAYRQWWIFVYGTDKWLVSPKLTLDLGARWEFYPPATPRKAGGFSNYDPANNQLILAGIGGNPSNLGLPTIYHYFAPRTGFAYRATDQIVLRGGFGISYMPFGDNTYAYNYPIRANNSYGLVGTSPYTGTVLADGVTPATFQNGFPAPVPIPIPSNGIIATNTPTLISQVYTWIPKTYRNPYVESWNLAVQQALPDNMSLQVAYVANHGVHASVSQNINNPSTYGGGSASEPEYHCVGCPSGGPFRTAATNEYFMGFSSNYQSLQVQLVHRTYKGLSFTSGFTWAKGMGYATGGDDNGSLLFFANFKRSYGPNDFDRTLNFEQSFTYELPWGIGHSHLSSGIGAAVLGGWKLSGVISAVTGTPFTVATNGANLNTPGTTQTGQLIGAYSVSHGVGSKTTWFNPAAFTTPSGCTNQSPCSNPGVGNTGRNEFRGPGYIQDNFSLFKSFRIFRESSLTTGIQATQLSNTPQFANPTSNNCCSATSFGQVTSTVGSGQGNVNGIGGGRSLQASARISF
ncbi:hypothetical protein GCM10011507_33660 [Edaphobacter acidisoli]|uniref:TonB-dependent transporter Oar-like beta-barrel domain-containing protein n=1 Tax=Edaphobacter acidisoli TaxID=2040573 RepID=A0A916S3X7_9BACT|nr:carboxypeptidase-like regulatory domain-containing protein [Edaphobacter acidisoli]GGA79719.1 hypothetical protein GCM10011507_33660 [Edaphobacter acidisoli]